MKPITQTQQNILNQQAVNLAVCWKVERGDGQTFAFTTHDKALTVSAVAYQPVNAFSESALEQKADLAVNNVDMVALTSSTITEGDLIAGKFDNADLTMFVVLDWQDTSKGVAPLLKGKIGEVEARGASFRAEVRGNAQAVQQSIVDLTSITCRADLGDAQCKVPLSPGAWASTTAYTAKVSGDAGAGSVVAPSSYNGFWAECTTAGTSGGAEPAWPAEASTVTDGGAVWTMFPAHVRQGSVTQFYDRVHFVDSALTDATDWFRFGKVTWTGGANNGVSMEVREFLSGGYITLWEPMPFDITIGDTFTIAVGCAKRFTEDCKTKFDNVKNFDGEPFLPGEFAATEFPDAR